MKAIGERLVSFDDLPFDDLCELSCEFPDTVFLGKVYHTVRARNAWHNNTIHTYSYDDFNIRWFTAQSTIERKRRQGSTWYIKELACLVFQSANASLLITEINTSQPLNLYNPSLSNLRLSSLYTLANWFPPAHPNSVIRLVTGSRNIPTTVDPLSIFQSKSRGGGVELLWRELMTPNAKWKIDASAMIKMIQQFELGLRPSPSYLPCGSIANSIACSSTVTRPYCPDA